MQGGLWQDAPCWQSRACLCETPARGDAFPAYLAAVNPDVQLATFRTHTTRYLLIGLPALWLFPIVGVYTYFSCGRGCRSRSNDASASVGPRDARGARKESGTILFTDQLMAIEREGAGLRARVRYALAQVGWMVITFSLGPWVLAFGGVLLTPIIGHYSYFQSGAVWGLALVLLSVRPVDTKLVNAICALFFYFFLLMCPLMAAFSTSGLLAGAMARTAYGGYALAAFVSMTLLLPTTGFAKPAARNPNPHLSFASEAQIKLESATCCCRTRVARRKLRRLWLVCRFSAIGFGLSTLLISFGSETEAGETGLFRLPRLTFKPDDGDFALLLLVCNFLVAGLVWTPTNRGRFLSAVFHVSKRGNQQQQAALVSALLGDKDATQALDAAQQAFVVLPTGELGAGQQIFSPDEIPTLQAKLVHAPLGQCEAFVSHSWRDDPARKVEMLVSWRCSVADHASFWIDSVCLSQSNIEESLTLLPLFMSGCKELVLLVGPSFSSRLWCAFEIFVFLNIGGDRTKINTYTFDQGEAGGRTFDAGQARTGDPEDSEWLRAMIETSFGNLGLFNKVVRQVLSTSYAQEV